ncbi:MAG: carboxylesterase family protein [Steroidobacteraceae bacterium]
MRIAPTLALALLIAGCGGGGGESGGGSQGGGGGATPGLATTGCGRYQGNDRGGSWSFLGIRYAAAPVGSLRWKSPAAPPCPADTVAANAYSSVCPQIDRATGAPEGDEDCLALNVYAPKSNFPSGSVPVMVFIHGGGNSQGSTSELVDGSKVLYDGTALAEATGRIVVTVQYRLGPLGWLVHPGLDAEAPDARSGNYGLEDLMAALRWVQRDIGAFGGDRSRVMIFGESAGGVDVCALLTSPTAAGLYQSALIESGGCVADTRDKALATGATLAERTGCSTAADPVACLRAKTPAELLAALPPVVSVSGGQAPYQPNVDGTLLPALPYQTIVAGQQNRVPVVIGTNADETGLEVPLGFNDADYFAFLDATFVNPDVRAQVGNIYSAANFGTSRAAYVALTSDAKFTCQARKIARALVASQSEPVFRYFFTEVPDAPNAPLFGAFHGLELLYLFGVMNVRGYTPTAAETALSSQMQHYWAGLAANGAPSAAGAPAWTAYDPLRDNHLRLDSAALAMADGVNAARCDFWDSLGL